MWQSLETTLFRNFWYFTKFKLIFVHLIICNQTEWWNVSLHLTQTSTTSYYKSFYKDTFSNQNDVCYFGIKLTQSILPRNLNQSKLLEDILNLTTTHKTKTHKFHKSANLRSIVPQRETVSTENLDKLDKILNQNFFSYSLSGA